jgi:hypothetical protein
LTQFSIKNSGSPITIDISAYNGTNLFSMKDMTYENMDILLSGNVFSTYNAYSVNNFSLYLIDENSISLTGIDKTKLFYVKPTTQISVYPGEKVTVGQVSTEIPSLLNSLDYTFYSDDTNLFYRMGIATEDAKNGYLPSNSKFNSSMRVYNGIIQNSQPKIYKPAKIVFTNYTRIQTPAMSYVPAASHPLVSKKIFFEANTKISGQAKTNTTTTTDKKNTTSLTSSNTIGGTVWGQGLTANVNGSYDNTFLLKSTDNRTSEDSATGILKIKVAYSTISEKAPAIELIQNLCLQNTNK